jgi:hypothetical protein
MSRCIHFTKLKHLIFQNGESIYYGVVHAVYLSTFCSFSLWDKDTFFSNSKKGSIPHKPVLITGPNLLWAQLAIAARVGGSTKVAQVIFFAKM